MGVRNGSVVGVVGTVGSVDEGRRQAWQRVVERGCTRALEGGGGEGWKG